ncbi:hypothetical protein HMPREF9440_00740 [Sutterella parvirubra YIT 11816]|uniref:Uncharacterized protein n=1 Tax=Sutterella parvirubra YIT 11816 TaxID=762967 RepID=H3KDD1_9BURK|nr:hypothetical protein HMPREF9440_00740 [Sutterella parvirubra YIT 11816]
MFSRHVVNPLTRFRKMTAIRAGKIQVLGVFDVPLTVTTTSS